MKATRPGLVHKGELGGVQLGLRDESAVRQAYLSIAGSLDEAEPTVALQPMVPTGVELVVGVAHDALFGSLVMLGLGGVHTDLLGDRSFRSLPLTDRDATAMWRELHAAPLLTGYRGTPAMDTEALEQLLLRVAQLAGDFPEVSELDLNPVVTVPDGLRLSMSSSSCSRPKRSPTRTFGAWPFDARIGRTTNWPGLVRPSPGRPSVLAEVRSPWGGPTVEKRRRPSPLSRSGGAAAE